MLRRIVRKEILEHLMGLRFAIACVICFIVVLASLFVRGQEFRIARSDYHEDAAATAQQIDEQTWPGFVAWNGLEVHREPNPLRVFVRGVDESTLLTAQINAHQPIRLTSPEETNPLTPLFPAMDLVNFVGIIMSLLALVFGHDAICGEKERGTLRLMLSYSVPRDTVLLAKWIGGYVSLVLPFILALVGGAAVVVIQPDMALSGPEWTKLIIICGIALVYIACVYSVAVCVSCFTERAATSIMVLVTVWMLFVLAVPNLSPFLARALRPTRNPLEIEISREARQRELWEQAVEEPMKKYDGANGFKKAWWNDINWSVWEGDNGRKRAEIRQKHEMILARDAVARILDAFAQLDDAFLRELDQQVALSRGLSRLSPFSCFALTTIALSDTGVLAKRRFLAQLREYQYRIASYGLNKWLELHEKMIAEEGKQQPWTKDMRKQDPIPVFTYVPAAVGEYAREVAVDVGILAALTLLFFMFSHIAFLRYDVR